MSKERKEILIIIAVVVFILVAYVLSGIFMKPEPQKTGDGLRSPVNRLEKIREGFTER